MILLTRRCQNGSTKEKVSKARRDKSVQQFGRLDAPALCKCSNCGDLLHHTRFTRIEVIIKGIEVIKKGSIILIRHIEAEWLRPFCSFCCSSEKGGETLFTSTFVVKSMEMCGCYISQMVDKT